jgi:hypothetical protein
MGSTMGLSDPIVSFGSPDVQFYPGYSHDQELHYHTVIVYFREGQSEEEEWQLDQIIWTILFSFILVVAMLGNSIVIWIILGKISLPFCLVFPLLQYIGCTTF